MHGHNRRGDGDDVFVGAVRAAVALARAFATGPDILFLDGSNFEALRMRSTVVEALTTC
jgi:ABC-type proline/glycine betaine transport system ATPase subunit